MEAQEIGTARDKPTPGRRPADRTSSGLEHQKKNRSKTASVGQLGRKWTRESNRSVERIDYRKQAVKVLRKNDRTGDIKGGPRHQSSGSRGG